MENSQGNSMPDLSGILNMLTANPSLISGIASLIGSQGKQQNNGCKPECPPPPPPDCPPPPCEIKPPCKCGKYKNEIALLVALKPFLSKERCSTIDYVIKIADVIDMFNGCR